MRDYIRHGLMLACCTILCMWVDAMAAESPTKPHQIIDELVRRMYAIGETTGQLQDFVETEAEAAEEIRVYVKEGEPPGLTEENKAGQTPLMAAAFMGYSELVRELLRSAAVRESIDYVSRNGMSAMLYANTAPRQTMWVCNPTLFSNPFAWIPLVVTQPYYVEGKDNPYRKTRRLLEEAGGTFDLGLIKKFWQEHCELQDAATREKVKESKDILDTLLRESAEILP